eukprot:Rmarinus@m.5960
MEDARRVEKRLRRISRVSNVIIYESLPGSTMTNADAAVWLIASAALAGAVSGATVNSLLYPLDTAKTLRQALPGAYRSSFHALVEVVRTRGVAAVYSGAVLNSLGSACSSAIYFGTYEGLKLLMGEGRVGNFCVESTGLPKHHNRPRVSSSVVAAFCGNILSSFAFVPKEVLKQRFQLLSLPPDGLRLARRRGLAIASQNAIWGELSRVIRREGVGALYAGWIVTLLRNAPSAAIRFSIYEALKYWLTHPQARPLKHWLLRPRSRSLRRDFSRRNFVLSKGIKRNTLPTDLPRYTWSLRWVRQFVAGSLAGALSSAATTPLDVLKTRYAVTSGRSAHSIPTAPSTGVGQPVAAEGPGVRLLKGGLDGSQPEVTSITNSTADATTLFAGMTSRVLWSSLFAALGLVVYENVREGVHAYACSRFHPQSVGEIAYTPTLESFQCISNGGQCLVSQKGPVGIRRKQSVQFACRLPTTVCVAKAKNRTHLE